MEQNLPKAYPHEIIQVSTQHLSHHWFYEAGKRGIDVDSDVLIVCCGRSRDLFFIVDCPLAQFHREVQAIFPPLCF